VSGRARLGCTITAIVQGLNKRDLTKPRGQLHSRREAREGSEDERPRERTDALQFLRQRRKKGAEVLQLNDSEGETSWMGVARTSALLSDPRTRGGRVEERGGKRRDFPRTPREIKSRAEERENEEVKRRVCVQ